MKKIKYQLGWEFYPDEEYRLAQLRKEAPSFWAKMCATGAKRTALPMVSDRAAYAPGLSEEEKWETEGVGVCPVCGTSFTKTRYDHIYCCRKCSMVQYYRDRALKNKSINPDRKNNNRK